MEIYRIAFIGHRKICGHDRPEETLEALIKEKLCGKEYAELYVGCNGDFDTLAAVAAKMVQKAQGKQNSRLVLIQPYPMKDDPFYEGFFDEVRYPVDWKTNPKAAITKRNRWMVDHADLLVAFVESDRSGDASATLEYAKKRGVEIINLAIQER